jgi:hypothetical protein
LEKISQKSLFRIDLVEDIALPIYNGSNNGVASAIAGNSGCGYFNINWVGNNNGNENSNTFRCFR